MSGIIRLDTTYYVMVVDREKRFMGFAKASTQYYLKTIAHKFGRPHGIVFQIGSGNYIKVRLI